MSSGGGPPQPMCGVERAHALGQAIHVNSEDNVSKVHSASTMETTMGTPPSQTFASPPTQSPTFPLAPHSNPLPPVSPVAIVNGCPCDLDAACKQECCVESLRAMHRTRLAKVNVKTKLIQDRKGSNLSYGSLNSTTGAQRTGTGIASPVSTSNYCVEGAVQVMVDEAEVRTSGFSTTDSIRCKCHKPVVDSTTRKAVLKLVIASVIALLFMIGEVLGESGAHRRGTRVPVWN